MDVNEFEFMNSPRMRIYTEIFRSVNEFRSISNSIKINLVMAHNAPLQYTHQMEGTKRERERETNKQTDKDDTRSSSQSSIFSLLCVNTQCALSKLRLT